MDDLDQLRLDFLAGRLDAARLLDLIAALQRQLRTAQNELSAARQRLADLEKLTGAAPTPKLDES